MVFNILSTGDNISNRHTLLNQPLKNEFGSFSIDDMQRYVAKNIMLRVKNTPELLGMLDTLTTDHFMGPVDYFLPNGKPMGPTQLTKAKKQFEGLKVREAWYGQSMDYFIDGNGFGWHTSAKHNLGTAQLTELKRIGKNLKGGMFEGIVETSMREPKKISYIPASTTEIIHDEYGVLYYKQEASGKNKVWNTDQIVHIKLMELDGKIRGYSGVKALAKEIALIYMIKENMIAKLMNGGTADNIISLVNTNGTSKSRFNA
jgi:hypothetical protein